MTGLAQLFALAGALVNDVPEVLAIVEAGIAAFRANDQAGIDRANSAARALADAHKPPDA